MSSITVFDKFTYAANHKNYAQYKSDSRLKIVEGDICDIENLSKAMKGHDFVINFAAESHVDRSISDASLFVSSNVIGTYNVLESSKKNSVRTLIQISTDEVYGSVINGSALESDPLNPNSPYSASKAAGDLLARSYNSTYNLDVRIVRSCNNYGKHQYPEKVIPVFIRSVTKGRKIPIYGTGKNIRQWIHVSDNCKAIQTVLQKGKSGEIYNVGDQNVLSNYELASMILNIMGAPDNMYEYVPDRLGHDFRYSVNSSKIISLGFKPTRNFQEEIRRTVEWYSINLDWWQENF